MSVFVWFFLFAAVVLLFSGRALALDTSSLQELAQLARAGAPQLAQLARAGAPQLALRRMDAEQPDREQEPASWMAWEQERLQILASQQLYAQLIARVDRLPAGLDAHFMRLALSLKADARLQQGDAEAARATVRELLWFHDGEVDPGVLARWRRLVVRSYVLENRSEDARLALLRYRQDFGDENPQWRWLSAQVMLQSGHPDSAFRLLQQDTSPQGSFLRYTAGLRVAPERAAELAQAAVRLAQEVKQPGLQSALWGLAATAAQQAGEPYKQIDYLEHALSLPFDTQLTHGVLEISADQLWAAYLAQGKRIGNSEEKLLGSDEDWYFPATEALEKDPLRARVLFSILAEYGATPQRRSLAHEYLVGMFDELPEGKRLIQRLYLESQRYADVDDLPPVIRYRLIDEALESGELKTASRLMAGLAEPPAGGDRFAWDLRRARVAIFTDSVSDGVQLLQQLLEDEAAEWSKQRIDRLLQVVFDLQTLKYHRQALQLFNSLLEKDLEAQQRRELLFWVADSLRALEQYDRAAYLYLKSATLLDASAMDPWAQTARYRAAKALVEAGLLDDARRIYGNLLRATRDASRKAVLKNEIQRLHLVSSAQRKTHKEQ